MSDKATNAPRKDGLLTPTHKNREPLTWLLFLVALIGIPALNHFGHISIDSVKLLGQYFSLAIVAVSLDLIWGYAGLLCLCQALFFCLGGYAIGMYLAHHGGPEGLIDRNGWKIPACLYVVYPYAVGEQPSDALVPWFWKPFWNLWTTLILGVLIPGAVAGTIGFFVFRSRVRGVYFAVLTQAIALAAWLVFGLNDIKCGGTNGLTRFDRVILSPHEKVQVEIKPDRLTEAQLTPDVVASAIERYVNSLQGAALSSNGATFLVTVPNATNPWHIRDAARSIKLSESNSGPTSLADVADVRLAGYQISDDTTRLGLYVLTVASLAGAYALCRFVIKSRVGQVLIAIRDNENRLRFFGYEPYHFKVFVFALSAMLAGLGGMLYVPQMAIITPDDMKVTASIMAVIWVAVGGRSTLKGPILGALLVNLAYFYLSSERQFLFFLKDALPANVYRHLIWIPDYWMLVLGCLFVAVVLLLPDGLISIPQQIAQRWRRSLRTDGEDPAATETAAPPQEHEQGDLASLQTRLQRVVSLQRERTISSQHRSLLDSELVRVENVKVVFDGFKALDIEKFSIDYYELQVVIGPNGAGKTTLCDVISGKTRATSGQVFFGKREITQLPEVDIARLGVGRKFQTPSIFDGLTVFESMQLALPGRQALVRNFGQKASPADRERIFAILKRVRLDREANQRVKYLSHGQRQWLEISMLLLAGPHLLLVDEPAAGLTDEETALTAELLLELQDEHSVMVIEHDMEFVRLLNAPVTVLNEGSVMAQGTLDQVQADPRVVEAYLGRGGTRQQA